MFLRQEGEGEAEKELMNKRGGTGVVVVKGEGFLRQGENERMKKMGQAEQIFKEGGENSQGKGNEKKVGVDLG